MALKKLLIFLALGILTPESYAFVASAIKKSRDVPQESGSLTDSKTPHQFVVLGASGDLAKREIYPALWTLYRENLLPPKTKFFGYARKHLSIAQLREHVAPFVKVNKDDEDRYEQFWKLNTYVGGTDGGPADYDEVNRVLSEDSKEANRIFYLALPPSVFNTATTQIKRALMSRNGWTRIAIEKPFGRDLATYQELSKHISSLFSEDQVYRTDHFLGYEMVQNILSFRFSNRVFAPAWSRDNIAAVQLNFRENFGIEGRGVYFDENGIIRDVVQNHMLQVLALVAMEKPASSNADDVRDAKVSLLKKMKPIVMEDVVLGQYVGNPQSSDPREHIGYLDDTTVPAGSIASTFSLTVLRIDNDRWRGVPFIIRAGKALNANRTEVIVQYKNVTEDIFKGQSRRNELIIRLGQTDAALQTKINSKTPGFSTNIEDVKIDFDYKKEYSTTRLSGAYERLLLDMFLGSQVNFVRDDELSEAWRIFTPILHDIENKKVQPIKYKFGSTGPVEADKLEKRNDFFSR